MQRWTFAWIVGAALVAVTGVACAAPVGGGTCRALREGNPAAQIRDIQRRLAAAMPKGVDAMGGDVPPGAQADIATLKRALATAADAELACVSSSGARAPTVRARLTTVLGGLVPQASSASGETGLSRLDVSQAAGSPRWLLVRMAFPVPGCGTSDNMAMVYAPGARGWRRVAWLRSKPYATINGAWGDFFDAAVLPAAAGHGRRIVIAHGTPACASQWSTFHVGIFEPGANPDRAHRSFSVTHGYARGNDAPTLRVISDGFDLRVQQCVDVDPDLCYSSVFTWRATEGGWVRTQPVALDPRGFVAAWFNAHWDEASQWTEAAARSAQLRLVHDDTSFGWSQGFMRLVPAVKCGGSTYQVELRHGPRTTGTAVRWFSVRDDGGHRYMLLGSSAAPASGCVARSAARSR